MLGLPSLRGFMMEALEADGSSKSLELLTALRGDARFYPGWMGFLGYLGD